MDSYTNKTPANTSPQPTSDPAIINQDLHSQTKTALISVTIEIIIIATALMIASISNVGSSDSGIILNLALAGTIVFTGFISIIANIIFLSQLLDIRRAYLNSHSATKSPLRLKLAIVILFWPLLFPLISIILSILNSL